MRINVKLIIMSLLLGLPLVLITVVFINMTQQTLQLKIRNRHMDLATHLAARSDAFFNDFEKYVTTFLYDNHNAQTMEQPAPDNAGDPAPHQAETQFDNAQTRQTLTSLMRQFDYFQTITIMDGKGTILAQLTDPDAIAPDDILNHLGKIPYEQVIQHKKLYYSPVYYDDRNKKLLRTAAFPFPDGQHLLAVEISLMPLQKIIAGVKFDKSGAALLLDEKGRIIAHPDPKRSLALEDMSQNAFVINMYKHRSGGVGDFTDNHGREMLGAYHPVRGEWFVLVEEPQAEAYYTAMRMKNMAWIAVLASVLLAFLAGVFIARSIIGPMRKLVFGTQELSKGNLQHKVPIKSRDEMGVMARAFNQMSDSLFDRDKAIEQINDTAKKISSIINQKELADMALAALRDIGSMRYHAVTMTRSHNENPELFAHHQDGAPPDPQTQRVLNELAGLSVQQQSIQQGGRDLPADFSPAVAVPLIFEHKVKGAFVIAGKNTAGDLTITDLQLYEIIASSVAISLQNIELLEDTIEKTRMEQELKTAELVQQTLFPENPPQVPGLDLSGYIESASETGGDWYGFIHEPENRRVAVLIADVTGHGVPAALVTATTNSFFRTLEVLRSLYQDPDQSALDIPFAQQASPGAVDALAPNFMLRCLNEIVYKSTQGRLVLTIFASVYYYDEKKLVFANAGHAPPLVFRESGFPTKNKKPRKLRYLMGKGKHVGDSESAYFEEEEILLTDEDTILWYTDGLTECTNQDNEEFGEARLRRLFEKNARFGVNTIKDTILEKARAFYGDTPHEDDITFVIGKIKPAPIPVPGDATLARQSEFLRAAGALDFSRLALVVTEKRSLALQLRAFLYGHGIRAKCFKTPADAMGCTMSGNLELCIVPMNGDADQMALIHELSARHPGVHFVFTSTKPIEGIIPDLLGMNHPMRMIRQDDDTLLPFVRNSVANILSGPKGGMRKYLAPGVSTCRIKIQNALTRMEDVQPLFDFASNIGIKGYALSRIQTVADELLMNAIFDAPTDDKGQFRYEHSTRDKNLISELAEKDAPILEFGSDGTYIGIGVTDPFGSITQHSVLSSIQKACSAKKIEYSDQLPGGAGLGLYMIFRIVDHMVFNVLPGHRTEVICLIKLEDRITDREIKSFGYFEEVNPHEHGTTI